MKANILGKIYSILCVHAGLGLFFVGARGEPWNKASVFM